MVVACLSLVLLAGCGGGSPSEKNYQKIKVGMTVNEVESILGKADNSIGQDTSGEMQQMWDVPGSKKMIAVIFKNGKATMKLFHE